MFFFLVASVVAQKEPVIVKLDKIDKLKVYNGLNVNLIKSEEQKLEIIGERSNEILVKQKKGTVKISLDLMNTFNHQKLVINLYYNSNIAELDAYQAAVIKSIEPFKQTQLSINAQEGGYVKLNLDVDYLKVKGLTGGHFQIKGLTNTQNVSVVSGASYEAVDLESDLATVYVSTGSVAKINVKKALDAKAKLGGKIVFSGRPESVSTAESLGGKISKALEEDKDAITEKKVDNTEKV